MTTPETPGEDRFAFGKNWSAFSRKITPDHIAASMNRLNDALAGTPLTGLTFLDVGCGSGLSSLAALRLGARVHAFDFDEHSVATARSVLANHGKVKDTATGLVIEQGSVLDAEYLDSIGRFDVVYSWGVLHHTGNMWRAIELAADRVAPAGLFMLALYNDQGGASRRWRAIKRWYVRGSKPVQWCLVALCGLYFETLFMLARLANGRNPLPFADWRARKQDRGMSVWHDLIDWVGGYPFEVARPDEVFDFLKARGFLLEKMKTVGGSLACNEFLFRRAYD